jgi:hypothetical protein
MRVFTQSLTTMLKSRASKSPTDRGAPPQQGLLLDPLVTYGTGGTKFPASYEVLSLPKFHQLLLTQYQAETEALNELWHPYTTDTRRTRQQQHKLIETTFPFVVAGAHFDAEADAADDEDDWSGWQTRSGLVVVSFTYLATVDNEAATIKNRLQLQQQLLQIPLLGSSIVLVFKEPSECLLHALVATDLKKDYWAQVSTIMHYLEATTPKLANRLRSGDIVPTLPHSVGFDPQAYLRPCTTEGYAMLPTKLIQTRMTEFERKQFGNSGRKRGYSSPLR